MNEPTLRRARLCFDNRFVNNLPADTDPRKQPHQVLGAAYSRVLPTAVCEPSLVAYSAEVADLLDLDGKWVNCKNHSMGHNMRHIIDTVPESILPETI